MCEGVCSSAPIDFNLRTAVTQTWVSAQISQTWAQTLSVGYPYIHFKSQQPSFHTAFVNSSSDADTSFIYFLVLASLDYKLPVMCSTNTHKAKSANYI